MTQPRWLELAWGDLGVAETLGPQHTARVVAYYKQVGHPEVKDDETAWCAAFLGACLERAGIASTRSLMARSYLGWGDAVSEPRAGAIAVVSRTSDPSLGHVGFLVGETTDTIILLGGNQSDAVTVAAFSRSRLLGLRWPAPASDRAPSTTPPVIANDTLFNRSLTHILEMEGGWTDDPYDPGGPTNFGITLATYARDKGVELTAANLAELKASLRAIPAATVRRIYQERYWRPACCPQMQPALAFFHFDAAVNQGLTGATRLLQEAVGAEIDGEVGPETLGKASARSITATLAHYAEARRRHYRSLSTFWRFGKGWLARVDSTLEAARAIARDLPSQPSAQQQEQSSMTDTTEIPAITRDVSDTKWWGQSMTIWGVIITTLSTVLPAFGPLIGLDITAELIRQLGDQIVVIVQALGGLIGTILTIWGRARATTSLERKQLTMNL